MNSKRLLAVLVQVFALLLFVASAFAQETTGGLQGTVKDPSGAVIAGASVTVTGTTLVGSKTIPTDGSGYYRFANLPPGIYTITVTAKGFETAKREGLPLEVGHLPTVDFTLKVGAESTVVEVTGAAPVIDVTTTRTTTNITEDVVKDVPHGYSFQSVIQFAPGARNEPLAGGQAGEGAVGGNGTGGQFPGSGSNGQAFGYSIGGGADSENSYLVEGQETADAIAGYSHTNVPFAFVQEVQVKSSGIEAEYGGALGGVINVIMQKGGTNYHGSVFSQFESGSWDGSPRAYPRNDPLFVGTSAPSGCLPAGTALCGGTGTTVALADVDYQGYQPTRPGLTDIFPGFTFGGPLIPTRWKDKLWFFASFNPEFRNLQYTVNMTPSGPTPFSRNTQTYYSNARVDAALSQKIRVFGSWLYQYQRQTGENMPFEESTTGLFDVSSTSPPFAFAHSLGFGAPNVTTNTGLDYTITPRVVATFRWGYNFQNYRDFGFPTSGNDQYFYTSGVGASDNTGVAIPSTSQLYQTAGYINQATDGTDTSYNVTHHNQINGNLAWFKSGWLGTHNFKFGYQLNRLSNAISQHYNAPNVLVYVGEGQFYSPVSPTGTANCAPFVTDYGGCAGLYGYIGIQDSGSLGTATSMNHAFFAQDAWTIGHGVTINAGIRFEHEYLPAEQQPAGGIAQPIKFGWGSKIAPRIGAAWDPFRNGKWKVFGSYGKFYDIMKLNLAISSFGGQYWQTCFYALDTPDLSSIVPVPSGGRYCGGIGTGASTPANWGPAGQPAGITFLENVNYRTFPTTCATCTATEEGVVPGLHPYTQHESVFGIDHQLSKSLFFEARWDRRRLDYAIEDAAIFNPIIASETFAITNPGKGVNQTFDGYYNFLYGVPSGCTAGVNCPPNNIPAARSYDGVEFRLTKPASKHWAGMFSYTYSHFRGNYTGLTNTDISDGGGGRASPNNGRAFDEPFFSYNAYGTSSSGNLPTDRPNVFKGYAYYELPWLRKFATDFGIFQYAYQGSPVSTYADVGYSYSPYYLGNVSGGGFGTYIVGRGNWVDISQAPDGTITVGNPYQRRTPWFTQSDLQVIQHYKIGERKDVSFSVTVPNALNQRATVGYGENVDSDYYPQFLTPGGTFIANGPAFYYAAMTPYNWKALLNSTPGTPTGVMTINGEYGKPVFFQLSRNLYMTMKFTF